MAVLLELEGLGLGDADVEAGTPVLAPFHGHYYRALLVALLPFSRVKVRGLHSCSAKTGLLPRCPSWTLGTWSRCPSPTSSPCPPPSPASPSTSSAASSSSPVPPAPSLAPALTLVLPGSFGQSREAEAAALEDLFGSGASGIFRFGDRVGPATWAPVRI